ncbi:zinc finger, CCHC-type containing protein [Tanacetum coccineum]
MATPIDFYKFAMNRLKIDKLTKADLVGPVYNLLKGTYQSIIELEYNMKECYKALTNQLNWENSEGDRCPFDLSKPLSLKGRPSHLTVLYARCLLSLEDSECGKCEAQQIAWLWLFVADCEEKSGSPTVQVQRRLRKLLTRVDFYQKTCRRVDIVVLTTDLVMGWDFGGFDWNLQLLRGGFFKGMDLNESLERGDDITIITRRRQDPNGDGVRDLKTASEHGRLKEDLEPSTCSFHGLRSEDPNQHLKDFLKLVDSLDLDGANKERTHLHLFQFSLCDQASNWLERLLAGSITTWEDLTTRFLAQLFPPGRTTKLCNYILMFQQHHGESLSEVWTRFKDLLQKFPHHGIDLSLQVQIFYAHVIPVTRRTIDQSAGGNLRDQNAKESWALLEDLTLYDNEI